MALMRRVRKLGSILASGDPAWRRALGSGVGAAIEHLPCLQQLSCRTIVDVGANRGQFALAARHAHPDARLYAFEPLSGPAGVLESVFSGDEMVRVYRTAIGPQREHRDIHVSGQDDSSSLLPITDLQSSTFPGTGVAGREGVTVGPLGDFLDASDLVAPALLKIDVQGFELEALRGCSPLLPCFSDILVECSFVELYQGQALAHEVIAFLADAHFDLVGVHNLSLTKGGHPVQADFLFRNRTLSSPGLS